jgi:glycosyltransferase involved in cell wall biosynthesis
MHLIEQPLVSIGLPVFNGGIQLEDRIKSLLNQSYRNLELIICDNASTDATQMISMAAALADSRVRYIRNEENIGNVRNFNKAFAEAKGEYFMWAAHDDLHSHDFIKRCVLKLISNPKAVLCQSKVAVYVQDVDHLIYFANLNSFQGNIDTANRYREALYNLPAVALYGVFRTALAREIPGFRLIPGGDLLWIQELSLRGSFIQSEEILFHYIARKYWNSFQEDLKNLTRDADFPSNSLARAFWTLHDRISGITRLTVSPITKLNLLRIATQYSIRTVLISLIIRKVLAEDRSAVLVKIRTRIYWRYMHNPNVQIANKELFNARVVNPMLRIR